MAIFYARAPPAASLRPAGSGRGERALYRPDAALAAFLREIQLTA